MEIPAQIRQRIIKHARQEYPNECCGMLAYRDDQILKHYEIKNVERSPYRYSLDPRGQFHADREIEDNNWERIFYHSHTHSPAFPSPTDIRLAMETWPGAYYLLISLMNQSQPDLQLFIIDNGQVYPVYLEVS